jgi:porin
VRVKLEPTKDLAFLAVLFNGDPGGPGIGDPQVRNPHGLDFPIDGPPLLFTEFQYLYNQEKHASELAGSVKLGAWHHFGDFDDRRLGNDGMSLASPTSNGMPARLRGNSGIYGIIDQQIYRPPGGDAETGIAVFSRISASPSDRNLIDFYLDSGMTFSGVIASRPNDNFGASFVYGRISNGARALDQDRIVLTGQPFLVRNYEMTLEFTYQAQIVPGWTIQPDFQYVFRPGGNLANPNNVAANLPIKDAAIFGVRTNVHY